MYKIMIIDDDIPVLNYLEELIDWRELGLDIVYKTSSSIKALENLDEVKPDIILTDIGLPEVNGIELAALALDKDKFTRIIFLTCHEEFDFAKQALRLKADDYLLKDELTAEKLTKSLLKAISRIKQEKEHKENSLVDFKINNKHILKQVFMSELINKRDKEILQKSIKRFNDTWVEPDYQLVIGHIPLNQERLGINQTVIIEEIYQLLVYSFEEDPITEVFLHNNKIMLIVNFRSNLKFKIQEYLTERLLKATAICKAEFNLDIIFISHVKKVELENLSLLYDKILREKHRLFYEGLEVIRMADFSKDYSFIPLGNILEIPKRQLRKITKTGETKELSIIIDKLSTILISNNVEPKDVIREFIHFVSQIEIRTSHLEHNELLSEKMHACIFIEEALYLLENTIMKLSINNQPESPTTVDAQNIQKVDNYIIENMENKISAVDMANYLHLNPSYFSRYFKRISGYTFTDYVHKYKMTAASRYLLNTEETIESVGEKVGFYERTYFSKVFKKYIGESPSKYRNSNH